MFCGSISWNEKPESWRHPCVRTVVVVGKQKKQIDRYVVFRLAWRVGASGLLVLSVEVVGDTLNSGESISFLRGTYKHWAVVLFTEKENTPIQIPAQSFNQIIWARPTERDRKTIVFHIHKMILYSHAPRFNILKNAIP